MSWHITITNNYHETLRAFGMVVNAGDKRPHKVPHALGNGYIEVPGFGSINFIDIGDKKVGGHSQATWGVLLSYQGEELIFRYEGGGDIHVNINQFGQAELSGNGEFSRILLSPFAFKG
ncbi:MAG: hypothetical protein DMF64_02245 [Acidobacteria bacterium]|nr:MAG: hypothetical protein DMF64_02245 [Acidobacteriota bacterium]